jgi:hypothetical protein
MSRTISHLHAVGAQGSATVSHWLAGLVLALTSLCACPPWAATQQQPLTMGFYLPGIRDANLTDVRASLQFWIEEVGRPYELQAKALMYEDMRALYRDAMRGRVNFVIAPGMEIAETFTPEEITQGFCGARRGTEEGLALIVRKGNMLQKFSDLRGKRVLRLAQDRLAYIFLETQCQRQAASACAELFDLTEETRDVQSIHKVFFGKADAALVSLSALHTASEMNPQVGGRLQILLDWRAKSLSFGMMTVRSDPAYRDLILRSAMQATQSARGRQILELFKTDYMEPVSSADLQPFWRLLQENQVLTHPTSTKTK